MAKNSARLTAFSSTSLLKVANLKSTHSSKDVHFWWKKSNAVSQNSKKKIKKSYDVVVAINWHTAYDSVINLLFLYVVWCRAATPYQKRVSLQSNCSQSKAADPLCVKKGGGVYSGYNSSWLSSHQVTVWHCHIVSWHILLLKTD